MAEEKKKTADHHKGLWLIVLLLLIFTIATSALLASVLKGISAGEQNVIALFPNRSAEAMSTKVTYVPAKPDPEMEASDEQGTWEASTDIDLFRAAYQNAQNETSAESGDGGKVIAPGTENRYQFSLKNTGNVSLTYKLRLEGVFRFSDIQLPIEVRLGRGDAWLVGGEQAWGTVAELNVVEETDELEVGKYVTYTLEWKWPFESDAAEQRLLQDLNDTLLGNRTDGTETDFRLSICASSSATPGAVAEDGKGQPLYDETISHRTVIYIGLPLFTALGTGLLLLFLLLRKHVFVTGLLPEMAGCTITCGKKKDQIRPNGRFVFEKIATGKRSFVIHISDKEQTEIPWDLKRQRNLQGMEIAQSDGNLKIHIAKKVKAVELYLQRKGEQIVIDPQQWAAIDGDNVVYTKEEILQPDDQKRNVTPGGLKVDEKHRFYFDNERNR